MWNIPDFEYWQPVEIWEYPTVRELEVYSGWKEFLWLLHFIWFGFVVYVLMFTTCTAIQSPPRGCLKAVFSHFVIGVCLCIVWGFYKERLMKILVINTPQAILSWYILEANSFFLIIFLNTAVKTWLYGFTTFALILGKLIYSHSFRYF